MHRVADSDVVRKPRVLAHAPADLTRGRLKRLGEGIGKVVFASEHWVVKRERSPQEIIALIVVWKILRRLEKVLPGNLGHKLQQKPSRMLRLLRVLVQSIVPLFPKGFWFATHIREIWKDYHYQSRRGERLAEKHLTGTGVIPETVTFPPTRVSVGGWPGSLVVSEATERVEDTLYHRLRGLAEAERFEDVKLWLERFLDLRQAGWRHGLFSVDAHLKNFGVTEDRVVLIDTGGLTDHWDDVEERMAFEDEVEQPHLQLGLSEVLAPRPDIAGWFNERWKETVSREVVRRQWQARHARSPDA
jgi:hypothetical protein